MGYGLGVDLGTSFTRAAISRDGQSRMVSLGENSLLVASVVQVLPDGSLRAGEGSSVTAPDTDTKADTGADAGIDTDTDTDSGDGVDPARTGRDFKRRLGDPTPLVIGGQPHSAVSLLAATLASVLTRVTALEGGPPDHVVLTCPAVWGPYRREQFAEVPRRAGLDEARVSVTTEPEAAAIYYAGAHHLSDGDVVAVYDLGGGTFDTTLTRATGSGAAGRTQILGVPEGVEWVGGVDFDEAVLARLDQACGGAISALDPRDPSAAATLRRVRAECVRVKEELSSAETATAVVQLPGRRVEVPLTRAQFEDMIRTPLESTLAALRRTLASAGVEPAGLAGVLLVGGSSRIPLVSRMLSEGLGRPVLVDPEPQHCVALGAAELAGRGPVSVAPPAAAATTGGPALRPARTVRALRRRVLAAAGVVALLIAGATWTNRPAHDPPQARTQLPPVPALIGSASTTKAPKPRPTPTRTTAAPSTARRPSLPFSSVVLGLDTRCMDVANALTADGTTVEVFGCNGTDAQHWAFAKDGTIKALDKCLDAGASGTVQIRTCAAGPKSTDSTGQRWRFDNADRLVNRRSKRCLDVQGQLSADRTPLVTAACTTARSQVWTIPPPRPAGASASTAVPRRIRTITGLSRRPQGVAIGPDGTRAYVASVEGDALTVIDTGTGRVLRTITMPAAPQYVVAAPDGRRLYVTLDRGSAASNAVQVVDALTGKLLSRVDVGASLFPPALSPNGLLLYVPDAASSQVVLLDTFTYQVPARITVPAAPKGVAFSPDGRTVYTANGESGLVTALDVGTNGTTATIAGGTSPLGLAVSPDGSRLAVADYAAGSVRLIDTSNQTVIDTIEVGRKPRGVAFAPDGRHLYVADSGSGSVSVIDVDVARISATLKVGGTPWTIAVTPDGKQAYVSNATGNSVTVLGTSR